MHCPFELAVGVAVVAVAAMLGEVCHTYENWKHPMAFVCVFDAVPNFLYLRNLSGYLT